MNFIRLLRTGLGELNLIFGIMQALLNDESRALVSCFQEYMLSPLLSCYNTLVIALEKVEFLLFLIVVIVVEYKVFNLIFCSVVPFRIELSS